MTDNLQQNYTNRLPFLTVFILHPHYFPAESALLKFFYKQPVNNATYVIPNLLHCGILSPILPQNKKIMTQFRIPVLLFLIIATTQFVRATDRIVADGGQGGAFSTITDALNASAAGDRILIYPKSGGSPYTENIVITKNIQLLCAVEGKYFGVNGGVNVDGASMPVNGVVTISGMNLQNGNISAISYGNSGGKTKVNILGCRLDNGVINFYQQHYYDLNAAADSLMNGAVQLRYGRVIGCFIQNQNVASTHNIYVAGDAISTNDSILIVGNHILTCPVNGYAAGIYWESTTQYHFISNNYIRCMNAGGYSGGMYIYTNKNSLAGRNTIINNTIYSSGYLWMGILEYSLYQNSYNDIYNNLILSVNSSGYGGIYWSTTVSFNTASYNFVQSTTGGMTGLANNGTNNFNTNTAGFFNVNTGQLLAGADALNAGYGDSAFYDLDITPNDAGCYGGSFSLSQFHPMNLGFSRITYMLAPRRVTIGQAVNIKANSFDR